MHALNLMQKWLKHYCNKIPPRSANRLCDVFVVHSLNRSVDVTRSKSHLSDVAVSLIVSTHGFSLTSADSPTQHGNPAHLQGEGIFERMNQDSATSLSKLYAYSCSKAKNS